MSAEINSQIEKVSVSCILVQRFGVKEVNWCGKWLYPRFRKNWCNGHSICVSSPADLRITLFICAYITCFCDRVIGVARRNC